MEKAGLLTGGVIALGTTPAAGQAPAEPAKGQPAISDRPIAEIAKFQAHEIARLTPRARKLSQADMVALASGEKRPSLSGLTVGDLRSLNDVVIDRMTLVRDPNAAASIACCCCCSSSSSSPSHND